MSNLMSEGHMIITSSTLFPKWEMYTPLLLFFRFLPLGLFN